MTALVLPPASPLGRCVMGTWSDMATRLGLQGTSRGVGRREWRCVVDFDSGWVLEGEPEAG